MSKQKNEPVIRSALRSVVEAVESRRLMSVAVPDGFETVPYDELDVGVYGPGAKSEVYTSRLQLQDGVRYFIKASGTAVMSSNGRQIDAEFGQAKVTREWEDTQPDGNDWGLALGHNGRPISKVRWGSYDAQHEYGTFFTGVGNKLVSRYQDDPSHDNSGTIHLAIFREKVALNALTISDADTAGNSVTHGEGEDDHLYILEKSGGSATIKVEADASPENDKSKVLWTIEGDGASSSSGTFGSDPSITLTPGNREFTFKAGVDADADGTLSSSEATKSVVVTVVKVDFDSEDAATFLNTKTTFDVTVTPASAAEHVKLVIEGQGGGAGLSLAAADGGDAPITFENGLFELTLGSSAEPTQQVEVFGGNLHGDAEAGQAPINLMMETSDTREEKNKPVNAFRLSDWMSEKLEDGLRDLATDTAPTQIGNFIASNVKLSLQQRADPANNDPRQAEAQQALSYFNTGGEQGLKNAIKTYWNGAVLDAKNATLNPTDLRLAWDKTDLTGVGRVKGLRPGDRNGLSVNVSPVFNFQSTDTVLDNVNNLGDVFSKPGLFVKEAGASFSVKGIPNTDLSFQFSQKWKADEPAWETGYPTGEVKLKLLNVGGGTVNISGAASYGIDEGRWTDYDAKIRWEVRR